MSLLPFCRLALILLPLTAYAENVEITGQGYKFIGANKSLAIVNADGSIAWKQPVSGAPHDLTLLPNGNILFIKTGSLVVELDPKSNQEVWSYESRTMNGNEGKKVEVHAAQRLDNGLTMIAESGIGRIIEVDTAGTIKHQIPLIITKPHPHKDTRLARKLSTGNYLVSHEGDGVVREYDPTGKVVWDFTIPLFDKKPAGGHGPEAWGNSTYCSLRLTNGNTLISTGNGHSVLEVNPAKEIVWHLSQADLPGITLAWITALHALPDGTIVVTNCHAGPTQPQIFAITKDKKVTWTYRNFRDFDNSLAMVQLLEIPGVIR
jgi:outer membrane protein assembly factor BamB